MFSNQSLAIVAGEVGQLSQIIRFSNQSPAIVAEEVNCLGRICRVELNTLLYTVKRSGQNAVQRLAFMLEQHSCWMGLAGRQSLLLFGSDILTRDIATASTSTKPYSSCSSDL